MENNNVMAEIKTKYAEGSPCTILEFNGSWTALTEEQARQLADEANRAFAIRRFMRVVLDEMEEAFANYPQRFDKGLPLSMSEGEISFSVTLGEEATKDGAGMPITTTRILFLTVTKMVAFDDGDGFYEFTDPDFEKYIESEMEGLEA